jgi:hypothetical protein
MLLYRHWQIRTALNGGVIGDDHARDPLNNADPGDDPGSRPNTIVESGASQLSHLKKCRARVDQVRDPVMDKELAALQVLLNCGFAGSTSGTLTSSQNTSEVPIERFQIEGVWGFGEGESAT